MNALKPSFLGTLALAAALLAGCAATSGPATHATAAAPRFPDAGSAWLKNGSFVDVAQLRRIGPGMNKNQVRELISYPHFGEGLFGPNEWDYLFNFRTGKGDAYISCQYKVVFDREGKAQTFHWLPAGCGEVLALRPAAMPAAPSAAVAPVLRMTTLADGLFRFDGSGLGDLQPEGRAKVEALAANLRGNLGSISAIRITGNTDRLGSEAYNRTLSLARANTVRDLLVKNGVSSGLIQTVGMGEKQPAAADCMGNAPSPALVACLQPDRRVDVEVSTSQ